jgi:DNA repair exonuclease SbcCD nuclease subunit
MFTFLHSADIHLDSPLCGLDRYEGAPVEEIRGATRRALANLVDLAIGERVAFVVLAGDLYDGDWRDFDTGLYFVRQMSRLREAGIPIFGVHGNHDAASKITRSLRLPDNVEFFPTTAPATRRLEELGVAVHGQSFASQCTTSDLAKNYPAPEAGFFNLGILHTSMEGREGHGSYAPCSESCLRQSGYDYWALGHIHRREVLGGGSTIAYPGNPQGRHIRETGPKGCLLVHVDDAQSATTEFRPLDVLRWEVLSIPLGDAEDLSEVLQRVDQALRSAVEDAEGRLLAARVVLQGETKLFTPIAADLRQWATEIRALAFGIGAEGVWIEKVKNETTALGARQATGDDDTPIAEVAAIVEEYSAGGATAADLGVDFSDLLLKLPHELRELINPENREWWLGTLRAAQAKLFTDLRS